jgi:hypothetical protein
MSPLSLLVLGEGPKSLTPEGVSYMNHLQSRCHPEGVALHEGEMMMGLED